MDSIISKTPSCLAFLCLGSFVAYPAMAQTPLEDPSLQREPVMISTPGYDCTQGMASTQFALGFDASFALTWGSWVNSGMDRNDVSNFVAKAAAIGTANLSSGLGGLDPVNTPEHNTLGCRFWGSLSGVIQGVESVLEQAVLSCGTDGAYYADFAATIYCELADNFGALAPAPLFERAAGPCSTAFESACAGVYEAKANEYVTNGGTRCSALKEADYRSGYESVVYNDCTFERLEDISISPPPSKRASQL